MLHIPRLDAWHLRQAFRIAVTLPAGKRHRYLRSAYRFREACGQCSMNWRLCCEYSCKELVSWDNGASSQTVLIKVRAWAISAAKSSKGTLLLERLTNMLEEHFNHSRADYSSSCAVRTFATRSLELPGHVYLARSLVSPYFWPLTLAVHALT